MRPQRLRLLLIGIALAALVMGLESVGGHDLVLFAMPALALLAPLLGGWYFGEEAVHRLMRLRRPRQAAREEGLGFTPHLRVSLRQGPHLGSLQRRGPPAAAVAA